MSNRYIFWLKAQVHLACLAPLLYLLWECYRSATVDPSALGPDPTHTVTYFTGFGALRILVVSLTVSPLRKIIPQLGWLIRFRRMLGLYAFVYATLHLLTYLWLYAGWSWQTIADDLTHRRYIWAGTAAWALLVPLAATSTGGSIRKLGGKRWNLLHRLVYIAAISAVVHYWWIGKTGVLDPLKITIVLALLLLARPVLNYWRRRRPGPEAPGLVRQA